MDALRDTLADYTQWFLALHIIAVIAFMAGILYLPRLFIYHTETVPGAPDSERFKRMETKLLKVIINPAFVAVWVLGLLLTWLTGAYTEGWLHAKFALVIVLSGIHGFLVRCWRDFQKDRNTRSARFFRILNEVPTVLMIAIVILAVVRPF